MVGRDFIQLRSALLEFPQIIYRNLKNTEYVSLPVSNAYWDISSVRFSRGASQNEKKEGEVDTLDIINFAVEDVEETEFEVLKGRLKAHGIFSEEIPIRVGKIDTRTLSQAQFRLDCTDAMNTAFEGICNSRHHQSKIVKVILVIIPEKGPTWYSEVKRWGDCVKGIPTICVTNKKYGLLSYQRFCDNLWSVNTISIQSLC